MIDTCIICGYYDPNRGRYICNDCAKKGTFLIQTEKTVIFSINSKIICIGILTKEVVNKLIIEDLL